MGVIANVTRLQNYNWPGNVRELRNVVERAVILARGGVLDFDLPRTGYGAVEPMHPVAGTAGKSPGVEPEFLTEAELERRERENLLVILHKSNWKVKGPEGAAELLGVKPTTLFSRMRKMGIKPPE